MRAIEFKGQTRIQAERNSAYAPLPFHKSDDGVVTVCFGLSLADRIFAVVFGRVWLQVVIHNSVMPHVRLGSRRPKTVRRLR